ncbi:hypothetical protein FUAX_48360 (plasmid) [Fulvitalea axinellae]|uniref:MotA/TolQ/ExbB proton channel domain-containing protein n=1 Tax=Fulvitalea axinellae TaxID=1182444 RepID=A0AAU9CJX5_9BACT|nr:hypothetical protein FUAX_48360 [Fulvitalea axinellae]
MTKLFNLIIMGGLYFTGPLVIMFVAGLVLIVRAYLVIENREKFESRVSIANSLGLFAMVFGVFGQFLGLMGALEVIEQVGDISMKLLAGGLRVSFISTLFGVCTFLVIRLCTLLLTVLRREKMLRKEMSGK